MCTKHLRVSLCIYLPCSCRISELRDFDIFPSLNSSFAKKMVSRELTNKSLTAGTTSVI